MKAHSTGHFWFSTPTYHPHPSYIAVFRSDSAPHSHALLQGHATQCFKHVSDTLALHYTWLVYLLEEHAMLGYIELSLRSINIIDIGDFQKVKMLLY